MSSRTLMSAAALLLLVFFVLSARSCSPGGLLSRDSEDPPEAQAAVGDHDSVRDTLQTINQRMKATKEQVAEEREMRVAYEQGTKSTFDALREELSRAKRASHEQLDGLRQELQRLTEGLATLSVNAPVPVGQTPPAMNLLDGYTWIKPVGAALAPASEDRYQNPTRNGFLLDRLPFGAESIDDQAVLPAITIPENATLIGATAMTGLFGRVPKNGVVRDPLPFKIITGSENLAAQGWEVPNLENAVWRGVAKGDRTLQCVEGELISVTFVFADGTIRTVSGGSNENRLGTLSDATGYPCLPGTYVTDFPKYLAAVSTAGAAAGAAEAFASAETTTAVTSTGSVVGALTGNTGKFVAGRAGEDAFREIAQLIGRRFQDTFDAVVIQPGAEVAMHLERAIEVDYETHGRRISAVDEEGRYVDRP